MFCTPYIRSGESTVWIAPRSNEKSPALPRFTFWRPPPTPEAPESSPLPAPFPVPPKSPISQFAVARPARPGVPLDLCAISRDQEAVVPSGAGRGTGTFSSSAPGGIARAGTARRRGKHPSSLQSRKDRRKPATLPAGKPQTRLSGGSTLPPLFSGQEISASPALLLDPRSRRPLRPRQRNRHILFLRAGRDRSRRHCLGGEESIPPPCNLGRIAAPPPARKPRTLLSGGSTLPPVFAGQEIYPPPSPLEKGVLHCLYGS